MSVKIGFISLGCEKNRIDMEIMMAKLEESGFALVCDIADSDVAIVNTCAFIDAAKEESIEEILEIVKLKREGKINFIIVTGCLAERYKNEIRASIPEVDAVISLGGNSDIAQAVTSVLSGEKLECFKDKLLLPIEGLRVKSTLSFSTFLKIAEGCNNWCTYCSIPLIRGKYRSRTIESIMDEAKWLAQSGVKELNIIAQDTSRYGEDIYGELKLPELLKQLCTVEGIKWIRLLYCYPDRVTDELLNIIADENKIVKYIDLPLQHVNGKILKAMNRYGSKKILTELIKKIRDKVDGIVIRTTFIVGFPGETQQDFDELCEFNKEMRFERMGSFSFSGEENTKAFSMDNQIDKETKVHRREILMEEQMDILSDISRSQVGKRFEVLVEGYDKLLECYYGRSYMDAPDVDTKVFFKVNGKKPYFGQFIDVKIIDVCNCDLIGEA